jgi:hypothetical protein
MKKGTVQRKANNQGSQRAYGDRPRGMPALHWKYDQAAAIAALESSASQISAQRVLVQRSWHNCHALEVVLAWKYCKGECR